MNFWVECFPGGKLHCFCRLSSDGVLVFGFSSGEIGERPESSDEVRQLIFQRLSFGRFRNKKSPLPDAATGLPWCDISLFLIFADGVGNFYSVAGFSQGGIAAVVQLQRVGELVAVF